MKDSTSTSKIVGGVFLALFLFFVVLPVATCVGCGTCAGVMGAAGDAKKATSHAPPVTTSTDPAPKPAPNVEAKNVSYRIDDSNPYLHKAAWQFTAHNNLDRPLQMTFEIVFEDADGFEVKRDIESQKLQPGPNKVSGSVPVDPKNSARIDSVVVGEL